MVEIPTGDWSWVDAAAMRFERAWKDGPRPLIEDYLAEVEEPQHSPLLDELLRVEIELLRRAGEQPDPEEYLERFPAHAGVVAGVFSDGQEPHSWHAGTRSSGPADSLIHNLDRSLIRGVLAGLAETGGSVPRVLLRDTEREPESPVVRPSSREMPEEAGRYQILGEIGHGGMGAVLKGRDPDLGRDLAVKILLEEHQHDRELVRRFIEEAQIGGQLQHPGIVPVYELGEFGGRRPYFTMKLVKGRTLAALLKERAGPAHDVPRFLGVFEQVCQTVAYAHARGVIHRDLKPSNIMVGSFGEVQVMDWGLAKVLPQGGVVDDPQPNPDLPAPSVIRTVRSGSDAAASRPGSVLGTPAYMAPEQAGGNVDEIDERADVFGLGSILCEILTGQPAYTGPTFGAILRKASRGDTSDALRRLDGCGAEDDLKALARLCLAAEAQERPRDAGVLAAAITAYLSGVQTRLRQAELDRVEAQARVEEETKRRILADDLAREAKARAAEERKRRRVTVALAAAVLALAALGGGTLLVTERSRSERRAAVAQMIGEARRTQTAAQVAAANDPSLWSEAVAALERAEGLLTPGGETDQKREIDELRAAITAERDEARNESEWLAQLIEIRSTKADGPDGASPDHNYATVFRAAGIDPDALSAEQVAARIRTRRPILAQGLVAALDDWAAVRREQRNDNAGARRLLAAARAADPDTWRDRLRVLQEKASSKERLEALRQLASTAKTDELPAVSLDLLGVALLVDGDASAAADVLRSAQRSHPRDAWLKYNLARALEKLGRKEEAIRYLMAARTLRPETAHELAHLLEQRGESDEALAIFADLVRLRPDEGAHWGCYGSLLKDRGDRTRAGEALEKAAALMRNAVRLKPDDVLVHYRLGQVLFNQGKLDEAIAEWKEEIRLNPKYVGAYVAVGNALREQGKREEGIAAYKEALRLKPDDAAAHNNLGNALGEQGKLMEAIAEYRVAIRLEPDDSLSHVNLGHILRVQGKMDEAVAEGRKAIGLKPDDSRAHATLGNTLRIQGKVEEAIAECRQAVRLNPNDANAHKILGAVLSDHGKLDEAIAECKAAIRLQPDDAEAHTSLGTVLKLQGKVDEAIAEHRTAIQLKPEDAAGHYSLANVLSVQGKLRLAIDEYRTAIRVLPPDCDPITAFGAHYNLGTAHLLQGEPEKATPELREAIRIKPDNAEAHTNLGTALLKQGKLDAAIGEFRTAIELKPGLGNAHDGLGRVWRAQGKLEEAIAEYREGIRVEPDHAGGYQSLGAILCDEKRDYAGAVIAFRNAIRLKPDFVEAHLSLGNALNGQGKLNEAIAAYRAAIRISPGFAAAHISLGLLVQDQGKLDEAIGEYKTAIRINPNEAVPHFGLGSALHIQGKLDEAIAEYKIAIGLSPKIPIFHSHFATALNDQGKSDAAILEFKIAISLNPKDSNPHTGLGNAMHAQGKLDEAIVEYKIAIGLNPKDPNPHNGLGNSLQAQGKVQGAIVEYKTAIDLNPKDSNPHNGLGNAMQAQGKLDEAIAEYKTAIRLNPKDPAPRNNLGNALRGQGKLDEAIAEYKTAIRLNPKDSAPHTNLGVALITQGKREEAVAEYREAVRLKPDMAMPHNNWAWALVVSAKRPPRDYEEGLVHAREAVELAKKGENHYGTLALAEYRSRHWAESLAASEQSMKLRKGLYAYDWYFQAMAHWQKGEKDEARKWFDKAVAWTKEKDPKNAELRQFWSEAAELLDQPGPPASDSSQPAAPASDKPR